MRVSIKTRDAELLVTTDTGDIIFAGSVRDYNVELNTAAIPDIAAELIKIGEQIKEQLKA